MNEAERAVFEAVDNMLKSDLGLAGHHAEHRRLGKSERGSEDVHNHADELFAVKVADSSHYASLSAAFAKVHSYMYLEDDAFAGAMAEELRHLGVPPAEADRAAQALRAVQRQLGSEQMAGWNDELDELTGLYHDEVKQYPRG